MDGDAEYNRCWVDYGGMMGIMMDGGGDHDAVTDGGGNYGVMGS